MRFISFGWTSDALLACRKTATCREWKDTYAQQFSDGELVTAYDKSPRFGGKPIAVIRLTHPPTKGNVYDILDDVYEQEGFAWYDEQLVAGSLVGQSLRKHFKVEKGQTIKEFLNENRVWGTWVIRFELVEVLT